MLKSAYWSYVGLMVKPQFREVRIYIGRKHCAIHYMGSILAFTEEGSRCEALHLNCLVKCSLSAEVTTLLPNQFQWLVPSFPTHICSYSSHFRSNPNCSKRGGYSKVDGCSWLNILPTFKTKTIININ